MRGKSRQKNKITNGYMFLYQLFISCWLADIDDHITIKKILQYAIQKYSKNLRFRKNITVTEHTLWMFVYHIKKHIPELRLADNSIYGQKQNHNTTKNTVAFKTILLLERNYPTDPDNPIFRRVYPTDTILEILLKELGIRQQ